jgi:hypothetical protein
VRVAVSAELLGLDARQGEVWPGLRSLFCARRLQQRAAQPKGGERAEGRADGGEERALQDAAEEHTRREGERQRDHVDEEDLGDHPRRDERDDRERACVVGVLQHLVDLVTDSELVDHVEAQRGDEHRATTQAQQQRADDYGRRRRGKGRLGSLAVGRVAGAAPLHAPLLLLALVLLEVDERAIGATRDVLPPLPDLALVLQLTAVVYQPRDGGAQRR